MIKPRVQLKMENFGPIVEGTIEFKPLTFLIGANNSGKTYAATLLYTLARVLRGGLMFPFVRPTHDATEDLSQLLHLLSDDRGDVLAFSELPIALRTSISEYLERQTNQAPVRITEALRRYFSVPELSDLTRIDHRESSPMLLTAMAPTGTGPLLTVSASDTNVQIAIEQPFPSSFELPPAELIAELRSAPDLLPLTLAMYLWYKLAEHNGFRHPHSYYLPAARSGILGSWPLMASLAVRSVSSALGRQRIDIPPLPSVVGDFLQAIIEQFLPTTGLNGRGKDRHELQPVLDVLEGQLLGGRVVIDEVQAGASSMIYESDSLRVPLQRASSMIAELAPVDLWVRELLEPDDLLIIDEPESHLHPENQRLIARALVRLVNAGVDVVAPTHSSTILHQVSNMLLASPLDDASRSVLGYTEADLISQDDVAVYLFEQRNDGTHIVPVRIESGFGISEDEFARVAEELGDETFRLSFAASQQPV